MYPSGPVALETLLRMVRTVEAVMVENIRIEAEVDAPGPLQLRGRYSGEYGVPQRDAVQSMTDDAGGEWLASHTQEKGLGLTCEDTMPEARNPFDGLFQQMKVKSIGLSV